MSRRPPRRLSSTPLSPEALRAFFDENSEDDESGCRLWTGTGVTASGYAYARPWSKHKESVHRLAWRASGRLLVKGLEIDHLCHDASTCDRPCRHRRCVREEHLAQVTHAENVGRSTRFLTPGGRTTCVQRGHDLTLPGAVIWRGCAECWKLTRERSAKRVESGELVPSWFVERKYPMCDSPFMPRRSSSKTCSRSCASKLMWTKRERKP